MPAPAPAAAPGGLLHDGAVAAAAGAAKTELGQFFTMANPFTHPRFATWVDQLPAQVMFVEPFAGANNLVRMVTPLLPGTPMWACYDVEPAHPDVMYRDTVADYPVFDGPSAVITNPPYMAKNVARRRGFHDVADLCGPHENLYQRCLQACLDGSAYVAAIIPESFITSGVFRDRLQAVISLTQVMFVDTEVPVCLALWGPAPCDDFEVWSGTTRVGTYGQLAAALPAATAAEARVRFNVPDGPVGLVAIDALDGPSIRFCPGEVVPASAVKHSARNRTRIVVDGLEVDRVPDLIGAANRRLDLLRAQTSDVTLTAFMGMRKDGRYRRRLDFTTARRLLAAALDDLDPSA